MNEGQINDKPKPDSRSHMSKQGWIISEGGNKCLMKPTIEVTADMERRREEVSRNVMNDFAYIIYYDPVTEVYWSEKSDSK